MQKAWAQIEWLAPVEGGRNAPFNGTRYVTIAHFAEDRAWPNESWSLVVEFENPLGEANPTSAEVHFLVEQAPQDLLHPGSRFEMLEGNRVVARGEIVESRVPLSEAPASNRSAASRSS